MPSDKIPSKIAYNTDPPRWGALVRPIDQPQASHFRLILVPRAQHLYRVSDLQAIDLLRRKGQQLNKEPIDFTADFFTAIWGYLRDVIFSVQFGELFLETQMISYVITVPATWSDSSAYAIKEAARRAGMPIYKLSLVSETEAAAAYCTATMCEMEDHQEEDRFLVCKIDDGIVVSLM